jgi:ketosteroid isomerase-like protein
MARKNVQMARQPMAVGPDSHRTLDQALMVRFPGVAAVLWRIASRLWDLLRPTSPIRRAIVGALARRSTLALNRGDLEVFSLVVHPEIESINNAEVVALGGLEPRVHGRAAWIEMQRRWLGDWDEFRYEPDEVIDFGDHRVLTLGRVKGRGRGSGLVVDSEWAILITMLDGLIRHEQNFLDHAEGLEAAGLSE